MNMIAVIYILASKAIHLLSLFYAIFIVLETLTGRKRDRKSCALKFFLCDAVFGLSLVLLLIQYKMQMPLNMNLLLLMLIVAMGMLVNYEAYKMVKRAEEEEQKKQ